MCAKNNPSLGDAPTKKKKEAQYKELCPFDDWQVDFTQMPKTRGNFKILLVFVDIIFWMGRGMPH